MLQVVISSKDLQNQMQVYTRFKQNIVYPTIIAVYKYARISATIKAMPNSNAQKLICSFESCWFTVWMSG